MIEFHLQAPDGAGVLTYTAFDGQGELGRAGFAPQGREAARILSVDACDFSIADGLLRCVLNYLLEHGFARAVCGCPVDERILRRLRFRQEGEVWSVALTPDIFSCGCG